MLARHLAEYVKADPDSLMFTAKDGRLLRNPTFHKSVCTPAVLGAGSSAKLRIHDLRPTPAPPS